MFCREIDSDNHAPLLSPCGFCIACSQQGTASGIHRYLLWPLEEVSARDQAIASGARIDAICLTIVLGAFHSILRFLAAVLTSIYSRD